MYGVDENYIEMKGYTLAKGRNIQYMDIADNKQICVIGDYINRTAYGGNAVGQTIKLGAYKFHSHAPFQRKLAGLLLRHHGGRGPGQRGQGCGGAGTV